jgi:signal transduction histidine kinase
LPDRPVVEITSDEAGNLWVGVSLLGFIRLDRRQLTRALEDPAHQVAYPMYNSAAGTAGLPLFSWFNQGTAKGPDGLLWFITARGLTILDPRALEDDPGARLGPPRIEGVTADDRRYRTAAATLLPAGVSRLLIDYAIVNLSSFDQIRFRYRLDGFDSGWVDGTGRRQASYTNLPPGRYTFRLEAAGPAQPWDDNAATTWSVTIPPSFHQTTWFYALCFVAVALTITGAWRFRARHMRRQLAAVLNERIRLSREVHDTLLQSLVWAALQLELASSQVERAPSEARAALIRTRKQLEAYIREARQSIWTLRSPTLDSRDLIGALRTIGEQVPAGGPRVALRITGPPRPCGAKVETQVLRIAQEAVANAVRHAQATDIDLHLDFGERGLRLNVADNGRGFDPVAVTRVDGHYGVAGMQERAAEVGGRCTIESAPGTGAKILVDIPLAS